MADPMDLIPILDQRRYTEGEMASFVHQIKMENGMEASLHINGIITPDDAQRAVNVQMIQKMGLLMTTGKPQLLLDQAKNVI